MLKIGSFTLRRVPATSSMKPTDGLILLGVLCWCLFSIFERFGWIGLGFAVLYVTYAILAGTKVTTRTIAGPKETSFFEFLRGFSSKNV